MTPPRAARRGAFRRPSAAAAAVRRASSEGRRRRGPRGTDEGPSSGGREAGRRLRGTRRRLRDASSGVRRSRLPLVGDAARARGQRRRRALEPAARLVSPGRRRVPVRRRRRRRGRPENRRWRDRSPSRRGRSSASSASSDFMGGGGVGAVAMDDAVRVRRAPHPRPPFDQRMTQQRRRVVRRGFVDERRACPRRDQPRPTYETTRASTPIGRGIEAPRAAAGEPAQQSLELVCVERGATGWRPGEGEGGREAARSGHLKGEPLSWFHPRLAAWRELGHTSRTVSRRRGLQVTDGVEPDRPAERVLAAHHRPTAPTGAPPAALSNRTSHHACQPLRDAHWERRAEADTDVCLFFLDYDIIL